MRHNFFSILALYYIVINLEISDFEMSDKFLDTSIASHEVLLYFKKTRLKGFSIKIFRGLEFLFRRLWLRGFGLEASA